MVDPTDQFSRFKALLDAPEAPWLGPQRRPATIGEADLNRKLDEFFARAKISRDGQSLLRGAALLWHDHLDASHTISQSIESRDGSWLHGIMHRREPDYGNAKYWFRRVGQHAAFPKLAERVAGLLQDDRTELNERLIENGEWMPFAFIQECERAEQGADPGLTSTLRQIQATEFDILIEHILSHA